jgi:hypothetical protein
LPIHGAETGESGCCLKIIGATSRLCELEDTLGDRRGFRIFALAVKSFELFGEAR